MEITSKLPNVGTNIFTVMSHLAAEHQAINLGQGYPDFQADKSLFEAAYQAMQQGHNQYPPMQGIFPLRQHIAEKIDYFQNCRYDAETEITITNGASEALMDALLAFIHPGDEVIVIEPCYDLYLPAIQLAGGIPVLVPMEISNNENKQAYWIDWQRVKNSINKKTRLMILNTPHNPTCTQLTNSDLDALEAIVEETGLLLLSDEVYEHISFGEHKHQSLCSRPGLVKNTILISSFGKSFHVTGWKVGYCCAPANLSQEIRKVHQFNTFTVATPLQYALTNYAKNWDVYERLSPFYKEKHDFLYQGLLDTAFEPISSQGTFFMLASYKNISNKDEQEFAHWLTVNHQLTVIPVSAFYADPTSKEANKHMVRFCFAKQEATLAAALEKLRFL